MSETGYVSSFDEREGLGFIRPVDDPDRVVKFRQSDLNEEAEHHIYVGQRVSFEVDSTPSEHETWDRAKSVTVDVEPEEDCEPDMVFESEAL